MCSMSIKISAIVLMAASYLSDKYVANNLAIATCIIIMIFETIYGARRPIRLFYNLIKLFKLAK